MKRVNTYLFVFMLISIVGSCTLGYFPPSDAQGGWRTLSNPEEIMKKTGFDVQKLDQAFDYVKGSTKNGGLLVVRNGWFGMTDEFALGKEAGNMGSTPFSTKTLWCQPGGGYSYATASIHIASIMVRHVSGMELQEYLQKHLASGLEWGAWGYGYKNQPRVNHTPGGGGIALRATDMLRFGYLLLHNGKWKTRQLIPEWYVRHSATASPYNPHYPYSLQFNVNTSGEVPGLPVDAFWKSGSGNHCLYVVPSLNLVVWKLGGRDSQYETADTGLTVHPEALKAREERSTWSTSAGYDESIHKTLEMVINSLIDK